MAEYIEREAAIKKIREEGVRGEGYADSEREDDVVNMLEAIPAADVATVVHGRWYWAEDCHCKCSVCGQYATVKRVVIKTNYCPNCGARMDGE